MKQFMKSVLSIICCMLMLFGCGVKQDSESNVATPEECMESFLIEFFSFDKEGRFSTTESQSETTYETLKNYTETTCFENLQRKRIPAKYDKVIAEKDAEVVVENIQIVHYADETYNFEVTLQVTDEQEYQIVFEGQITVTDDLKISNFYISNEKDFLKLME